MEQKPLGPGKSHMPIIHNYDRREIIRFLCHSNSIKLTWFKNTSCDAQCQKPAKQEDFVSQDSQQEMTLL